MRKKDNKSLEGKEALNNEESSEEGQHVRREEHVKGEAKIHGEGRMRKYEDDVEFFEITSVIVFHFLLLLSPYMYGSRNSPVGTATDNRMDIRGSNPGGGRDFSILHSVQTFLLGPPSLLSNGKRGHFPRG